MHALAVRALNDISFPFDVSELSTFTRVRLPARFVHMLGIAAAESHGKFEMQDGQECPPTASHNTHFLCDTAEEPSLSDTRVC